MHDKGPQEQVHDGAGLRIGIVHARWNNAIIDPLLEGAKAKLIKSGVAAENIVVESVPGAWELPIAVQRYVNACVRTSFDPIANGTASSRPPRSSPPRRPPPCRRSTTSFSAAPPT